jgi:hypothetical protein
MYKYLKILIESWSYYLTVINLCSADKLIVKALHVWALYMIWVP